MAKIKRYTCGNGEGMFEEKNGQWVEWCEFQKLNKELQRLLKQCNVSGQSEQFYCADWNRCGSICEEQCNACNKAENIPEAAQ